MLTLHFLPDRTFFPLDYVQLWPPSESPGNLFNAALCAGLAAQHLRTLGPHWQPQTAVNCAKPTPSPLWRRNKRLLCTHSCHSGH